MNNILILVSPGSGKELLINHLTLCGSRLSEEYSQDVSKEASLDLFIHPETGGVINSLEDDNTQTILAISSMPELNYPITLFQAIYIGFDSVSEEELLSLNINKKMYGSLAIAIGEYAEYIRLSDGNQSVFRLDLYDELIRLST